MRHLVITLVSFFVTASFSLTACNQFHQIAEEGGSGGSLPDEPMCAGVCRPWGTAYYDRMSLWYVGPAEHVPPCPAVAPIQGADAYAELHVPPAVCPACECAPAECGWPATVEVSATVCPADADVLSWGGADWDGSCEVAPDLDCNDEPCVRSLTVASSVVGSCEPVVKGRESIPSPSFGLRARECLIGPANGAGCATGEACVPVPDDEYQVCVSRSGEDIPCPDAFPVRRVVYAGVSDTRACTCECSAPSGASCAALVEFFGDAACSAEVASVTVTEEAGACVEIPPGIGVGSKSATWIAKKSATCAPSGGLGGEVVPTSALTLCCEPSPTVR